MQASQFERYHPRPRIAIGVESISNKDPVPGGLGEAFDGFGAVGGVAEFGEIGDDDLAVAAGGAVVFEARLFAMPKSGIWKVEHVNRTGEAFPEWQRFNRLSKFLRVHNSASNFPELIAVLDFIRLCILRGI